MKIYVTIDASNLFILLRMQFWGFVPLWGNGLNQFVGVVGGRDDCGKQRYKAVSLL